MSRPDPSRPADVVVDGLAAGGYQVVGLAGRGGSGSVWKAVDAAGSPVAVKVLEPSEDVARLRREAHVMGQVDHPGLPRVVEVLELDGRPVLVTDWVDGQPLAEVLADGPMAPQRALDVFGGLVEVLEHLHGRGIVHRDISPNNVMLGAGDEVMLIDFGLTRSPDSATLTATGMTAGTPRYVAPEVLAGETATPQSDQYAAAMLFHEMLTGQWAYGEPGASIAAMLHQHLHGAIVPPSEVHPWLASFDPVIERALSRDPADRYPSMSTVQGALPRSSASQPTVLRPSLDARGRGRLPGGRSVAVLLGALVLLVGVLGVRSLIGGSDGDATPADSSATSEWPSGTAASLTCNLLVEPDFESGLLAANFYDGVADRNEIVDFGGVAQSAALRVGVGGDFGLYGETVPIEGGRSYVFSAEVAPSDDVQEALVRVYTLDAERSLIASADDPAIGADEVEVVVTPGSTGRITLVMADTAPLARYAVPTIVKEGTEGFVLVDELVFAALDTDCADRVAD